VTNKSNNYNDSINNEDKDSLAENIKKIMTQILYKHASEEDDEQQWILQNCNNPILLKKLEDITPIMMHVVDAIGRLEPVNSITVAKDSNIPKGTVSKIIPKLISKGFIIKVPLPNNKKEYLFRITPLGKELFDLHLILHKQIELSLKQFFEKYDNIELQLIFRVLADFYDLSLLNDKS